jgi:SpoVK/Ycf46/Vps4 family AAA+-type ATPase
MQPLTHQREALAEITRRARAYYSGDWTELPVVPRWASLMVAPSGVGKTAVAAMAAAASSASMLRVSLPSWMPLGAHNRGTKETIRAIAEHVATHDRTMLVIDEIEKIFGGDRNMNGAGDGWRAYLANELFDLVDRRWPTGLKDSDGDDMTAADLETLTTKLKTTVFVLAIGTFQDWFDSADSRRSIGFGAEIAPTTDELSADIIAQKMPRELANRFNREIIRIPELSPDDYHRVANEVENQLPIRMREAYLREVQRQLPGAIAAKKGVRFVEEVMLAVLVGHHPEPAQPIPEIFQKTTTQDLCMP